MQVANQKSAAEGRKEDQSHAGSILAVVMESKYHRKRINNHPIPIDLNRGSIKIPPPPPPPKKKIIIPKTMISNPPSSSGNPVSWRKSTQVFPQEFPRCSVWGICRTSPPPSRRSIPVTMAPVTGLRPEAARGSTSTAEGRPQPRVPGAPAKGSPEPRVPGPRPKAARSPASLGPGQRQPGARRPWAPAEGRRGPRVSALRQPRVPRPRSGAPGGLRPGPLSAPRRSVSSPSLPCC